LAFRVVEPRRCNKSVCVMPGTIKLKADHRVRRFILTS
jgi:hypothetical protein